MGLRPKAPAQNIQDDKVELRHPVWFSSIPSCNDLILKVGLIHLTHQSSPMSKWHKLKQFRMQFKKFPLVSYPSSWLKLLNIPISTSHVAAQPLPQVCQKIWHFDLTLQQQPGYYLHYSAVDVVLVFLTTLKDAQGNWLIPGLQDLSYSYDVLQHGETAHISGSLHCWIARLTVNLCQRMAIQLWSNTSSHHALDASWFWVKPGQNGVSGGSTIAWILCWQSLIQVFVKYIQDLLYPLQCDQLTSCCCIQMQVAVAWDKLFSLV